MITPLQCRMARAALGVTVRDLARRATVPAMALSRFENGHPIGWERLHRLTAALDEAGIILVAESEAEGPGVRVAKDFRKAFIYDRDGKHVASIVGTAVIGVTQGRRIGTVKGDALHALDGSLIGTLGGVDVFRGAGSLPDPVIGALAALDGAMLEAPQPILQAPDSIDKPL